MRKYLEDKLEIEEWKKQIRQDLMFMESLMNYRDDPRIVKEKAVLLSGLINKQYRRLMSMVRNVITEEEIYALVDQDDPSNTIQNLIRKYGRKGLPFSVGDKRYQRIHPKTKKLWGIKRPLDFSKF